MSDKLNIRIGSDVGQATSGLGKLSSALDSTAKAGRKASGDFRTFQKQTRKLNDAFSNLARDGNRTTKVFKGLGSSALSVGNIFKGVMAYKLGNYLQQATKSAMDLIETNSLFKVSMGELTEETDKAIQKISELTGTDVGNLRDRIGTINMLGLTMGFTAKNAQTLGLGVNQLSLDMGALFNVPYQQALEDLRSGLIGQSRTLYKYGLDVTEAAIANEALAQGITKSVRHMTQGEKMMLRYSVIVKQSAIMQGEFANQFNQPMNQLRVLTERFVTLSRAIGKLFAPAMSVIIKYANAVVIALTRVFNALGRLFGIKMDDKISNPDTSFKPMAEDIDEGMDSLDKGLGKATKKAKELKKQLAGFDELNIIQTKAPETPSSGGAGGGLGGIGGGSPFDLDLELYNSLFDTIEDKAKGIADDIVKSLKKIWDVSEPTRVALKNLWDDGLSHLRKFTWDTMKDFYSGFLVPIGHWVLGEGLPSFFNITNSLLNQIDWERLRESLSGVYNALAPFAISIGEGLLWFYEEVLVPLGVWVVNNGLIPFFERLSEKIDSLTDFFNEHREEIMLVIGAFTGLRLATSLLGGIFGKVIPIGKALMGVISFFTTPTGLAVLAIAGLIAIGVALWKNWDKIIDKLNEWSHGMIGRFGETFKNIWDIISRFWNELFKPIIDNMLGWFVDIWNDSIKDIIKEVGLFVKNIVDLFLVIWNSAIYPLIRKLLDTFLPRFSNIFNFAIDIVGSLLKGVSGIIKNVMKIINGLLDFITGVFTGNWRRAWNGVVNIFKGIIGGIANIFKIPINFIISGINAFLRGLNRIKIPSWVPAVGGKGFNIPQIPRLADGGVLNMGQLFIAREAGAELVGNFGGKSAVMNNDDIVQSVTRGVYQAVREAMGSSNDGIPTHIVVNVGEDTLVDRVISGTNRQSLINGKNVITV